MQNKKVVKYRVFDGKDNYHQSYSSELSGASNWARDCARRVNGYVKEIVESNGSEVSEKVIFDTRGK
jgi:hypothetical protein